MLGATSARSTRAWQQKMDKIGGDLKEYQSRFNASFITSDNQISARIADILDRCYLYIFTRIKFGPTTYAFLADIEACYGYLIGLSIRMVTLVRSWILLLGEITSYGHLT